MSTKDDLLEQIKTTKKQLEKSSAEDIEALDVEYRLDGDLDLKNIIITLTTGGPRIDVDLGNYRIDGYWGGESVDYPIFEKETEARGKINQLWENFKYMLDREK